MTITVYREYNVHYNKKRIPRLMQLLLLKSLCRKECYNYIKLTPEVTAIRLRTEIIMQTSQVQNGWPMQSEFKHYDDTEVKKHI